MPSHEELVEAWRPHRGALVMRATVTADGEAAATGLLESTLAGRLESQYGELRQEAEWMAEANAPLRVLLRQDHQALSAQEALHARRTAEWNSHLEEFRTQPSRVLRYEVSGGPGSHVVGPDYDHQWTSGASWADRHTGSFGSLIVGGYAAAAIGVSLSSQVKAAVAFNPVVSYEAGWANWPYRGPVSSRGGIGLVGYMNGDPQPFLDRRVELWRDARDYPQPPAGANLAGFFATASPPPFPGSFQSTPLAQTILQIEPGNAYLLWMWCYGMAHSVVEPEPLSVVLAGIRCEAKFVVIDDGPPLPPIR